MCVIRIVSSALLGMSALMFAGSAAQAAGSDAGTSFGFGIRPTTAVPGGRITLTQQDCPHAVRVTSGVFDSTTIPRGHGSARVTVDRDARPGADYQVTFQCGDEAGLTDLRIAGGHPARSATPSATPTRTPRRTTHTRSTAPRDAPATTRTAAPVAPARPARPSGTAQAGRTDGHGGQDGHDTSSPAPPPHQQQPPHDQQYPQHGAHAGAGGTLDGFDRREFGVGAALVVGTFGAAYQAGHRRSETGEDA
jgi:hypothetical protein